jgi:hypothetical protein
MDMMLIASVAEMVRANLNFLINYFAFLFHQLNNQNGTEKISTFKVYKI